MHRSVYLKVKLSLTKRYFTRISPSVQQCKQELVASPASVDCRCFTEVWLWCNHFFYRCRHGLRPYQRFATSTRTDPDVEYAYSGRSFETDHWQN